MYIKRSLTLTVFGFLGFVAAIPILYVICLPFAVLISALGVSGFLAAILPIPLGAMASLCISLLFLKEATNEKVKAAAIGSSIATGLLSIYTLYGVAVVIVWG